ncbi:MAG: transglycosylase SLT domain-containing protein [Gammaproteobacteria bacterium]
MAAVLTVAVTVAVSFAPAVGLSLALALVPNGAHAASDSQLARPAGLEPDIAFWRRIFGEVSNDAGLVHDDARLDIVYAEIELPKGHTPAVRRPLVHAAVEHHRQVLQRLATRPRSALGPEEQRVLALWGANTPPATFAAAAQRVRFQLGQADRFRAGLVRSGLWAPFIERTLARYGVPPALIALPHVESGYDPRAGSHVGAMGLWQFMPGTARDFMRIDAVVDERMDPYAATDAAARLLRRNHDLTGGWATAITAYNHGAGGMQRAIAALGTRDIETIVRNYRGRAFGFASRNFYVSFLAAVDVRRDATRYFGNVSREQPDAGLRLKLPNYVASDDLARALAIDARTLARYNPSLRRPVWAGEKRIPRGYHLYLPARSGQDPASILGSLPANIWRRSQTVDRFHVVRSGETLSAIAPRYGLSLADIVAANGLRNPNAIRAGQRLVLPGRGGSE